MDGEKNEKVNMADILSGVEAIANPLAGLHEMQERLSNAIAEFQQTMQNTFKRAAEAHEEMERALQRAMNVDLSFIARTFAIRMVSEFRNECCGSCWRKASFSIW